MPAINSHEHPALSHRGLSAFAAMVLLFVGFAAPLNAQSTSALDYVDHISVDFAHPTVLNTNVALYYRDANDDLLPPPSYASNGTAIFYLFSTKIVHFLNYNSAGTVVPYNGGPSDWSPNSISFGNDVSLTSGSEVSYTPSKDSINTQLAAMTGSRNGLFEYNIFARVRATTTSLSTDPSGAPYTPGNALLATGYYSALVSTGDGKIYSMDWRNAEPGLLTPLVTGTGTGPGQLSNPSAMNVGPDGLLYVLDYGLDEAGESNGVNRIEKFDLATGEYRGQFFLPDGVTVFSTSLAISLNGHIYLGDGLGGGSVLDLDGNLLGTFHPPAADPSWVDGGLIAGNTAGPSFLQYDGLGNIFTYVEGQGLFMYHDPTFVAVPEPSTCALLGLAMGALFLPFHRRRLRSS